MFETLAMKRAKAKLLEAAKELREAAPLASIKASALAREVELKIAKREAGLLL